MKKSGSLSFQFTRRQLHESKTEVIVEIIISIYLPCGNPFDRKKRKRDFPFPKYSKIRLLSQNHEYFISSSRTSRSPAVVTALTSVCIERKYRCFSFSPENFTANTFQPKFKIIISCPWHEESADSRPSKSSRYAFKSFIVAILVPSARGKNIRWVL